MEGIVLFPPFNNSIMEQFKVEEVGHPVYLKVVDPCGFMGGGRYCSDSLV